ncbi:hypothetical protein CEXT_496611 [Caerostris extrusa]|uniref:Uncharacterized protein n=1 Tax=Caerostris extrusa TaxID=172846 RepID=A0AAV4R7Z9_CAEEX|nr:hypothetical protein CEXT_496611 [Caerostris extrusa]
MPPPYQDTIPTIDIMPPQASGDEGEENEVDMTEFFPLLRKMILRGMRMKGRKRRPKSKQPSCCRRTNGCCHRPTGCAFGKTAEDLRGTGGNSKNVCQKKGPKKQGGPPPPLTGTQRHQAHNKEESPSEPNVGNRQGGSLIVTDLSCLQST